MQIAAAGPPAICTRNDFSPLPLRLSPPERGNVQADTELIPLHLMVEDKNVIKIYKRMMRSR